MTDTSMPRILVADVSLPRVFMAAVRRDLLVTMRRRADVLTVLAFFLIAASLFPLGVGAEPDRLRSLATGVIWVCALLASMLGLARMFGPDHADGTLEQVLLGGAPLPVLVAGRVLAHWLVTGLPLVVVAPLLAVQFDLPPALFGVLTLSLLLGTPVLSLIGAIGAALTLGLHGAGALLSLLVLPLYVPVLIIGAGAVETASAGLDPASHFMVLTALLLVAAAFAPWAIAVSLRISVE